MSREIGHEGGRRNDEICLRAAARFCEELQTPVRADYQGLTKVYSHYGRYFDADRDGRLLQAELDMAIGKHGLPRNAARFAVAMELLSHNLNRDCGVSKADLASWAIKYKQSVTELASIRGVKDRWYVSLAEYDRNSDRSLSMAELDKACNDKSSKSSKLREAAGSMRARYSSLTSANPDVAPAQGITWRDVAAYEDRIVKMPVLELPWEIDSAFNRMPSLGDSELKVFGAAGHDKQPIKPEGVEQGNVGDCFLLAALGSVAQVDPACIRKSIRQVGQGLYQVTFAGDPKNPVTIAAPARQELAIYAAATPCGTWANLVEKAYGAYCLRTGGKRATGIPALALDAGGNPGKALEILTGRKTECVNSYAGNKGLSDDALNNRLASAFRENRPVAAGILERFNDSQRENSLPDGHAYSVIGYNPVKRTVTIRNPWGSGEPMKDRGVAKDGIDDGIFKMSLKEFRHNFPRLYFTL